MDAVTDGCISLHGAAESAASGRMGSPGDASSEWDFSTPGDEIGLERGSAGDEVVESATGDRMGDDAIAVFEFVISR